MMPPTMTTARVVTTIYVFAPFARVYIVIRTSEATFTPCIVVTPLAGVMGREATVQKSETHPLLKGAFHCFAENAATPPP